MPGSTTPPPPPLPLLLFAAPGFSIPAGRAFADLARHVITRIVNRRLLGYKASYQTHFERSSLMLHDIPSNAF